MLAKQVFFAGYSDERAGEGKPAVRGGGGGLCLRGLRTFKEVDGWVRVGMKAWIGVGREKGERVGSSCLIYYC